MLPQKFNSLPSAIASYDYTDIASAVGYSLFYGAVCTDGTGILTTEPIYSAEIEKDGTDGVLTEETFEVTFNAPQTINGNAILTFCNSNPSPGGGFQTAVLYLSGSALTTLGTFLDDVAFAGASNTTYCAVVPIVNQQVKVGDVLRLFVSGSGAATSDYGWGVDPMNRDGSYITPSTEALTTQLKLYVPFRIDL